MSFRLKQALNVREGLVSYMGYNRVTHSVEVVADFPKIILEESFVGSLVVLADQSLVFAMLVLTQLGIGKITEVTGKNVPVLDFLPVKLVWILRPVDVVLNHFCPPWDTSRYLILPQVFEGN